MNFKDEDMEIIKRINSNSIHAQQSESNNDPVAEVTFLSLVISDSVTFAELLWQRNDYEHTTEYVQNGIECNIRILSILREMKQNNKK